MIKWTYLLASLVLIAQQALAQNPHYTVKHFVSTLDTAEFKEIIPEENGFSREYFISQPEIWDVDNDNTTHITTGGVTALVCAEGNYENGLREKTFSFFIIDSADHSKRYKIWEQTFVKGKLNGSCKSFNLRGTCVRDDTFVNDTISGKSTAYWIDGKSIMEMRNYTHGSQNYDVEMYYLEGNLRCEMTVENDLENGPVKAYHSNGALQEASTYKDGMREGKMTLYYDNGKVELETFFVNDQYHGQWKYYFPNGQLWTLREYVNGLIWNVVVNNDFQGNKKFAGTLKNGNGSLMSYNDDGTMKAIEMFKGGKRIEP